MTSALVQYCLVYLQLQFPDAAQVDNQPFQTVNVTGPIQSVIEAYVRVSDCLRSFDPKKSKMLRGIDDPNPIANVPIPQNQVYNSSANFGAGSVMATDQSQYITAGQQHQTFIIQAPIQSTPGMLRASLLALLVICVGRKCIKPAQISWTDFVNKNTFQSSKIQIKYSAYTWTPEWY